MAITPSNAQLEALIEALQAELDALTVRVETLEAA